MVFVFSLPRYLRVRGECWDTMVFDPNGQGGPPDVNIHTRGAGFMGFKNRRDAEEYLHLLFQWDEAIDKKQGEITSKYATGNWKVWIFYLHTMSSALDVYRPAFYIPKAQYKVPKDWKEKKSMTGKISGYVNE